MLEANGMNCCAATEIDGLDQFNNHPKQAMLAFCKNYANDRDDDDYGWSYDYRPHRRSFKDPGGLVVFTGVILDKDGNKRPKYAQQFAAFIERNKLGVVVAGPARYNRVNHPDHLVKMWIWAPNYRALRAWYYKNSKD